MTTSSAPNRNPPNTAPDRLPNPPTIVAIKAFINGVNPIVDDTEPRCASQRTPAIPARIPEIANVPEKIAFAFIPIRRAMEKSSAAARSDIPNFVRFKKMLRATTAITVTTIEVICTIPK